MAALSELGRRGTVGALALVVDMLVERWPDRWSDVATALAGLALGRVAQSMPGSLGLWAEAAILSTALGANRTRVDAGELALSLDSADLPGARRAGTRLTGRDVGALTDAELASHGADAVTTATADGVVAPLLYYVLAGLPGVMAYQLLVSGAIAFGAKGQGLLYRARLLPRRIADSLGLAARRLKERLPSGPDEALAQEVDSGAVAVREALGQMRASVALAGGALLLLAAVTRVRVRPVRHASTKG